MKRGKKLLVLRVKNGCPLLALKRWSVTNTQPKDSTEDITVNVLVKQSSENVFKH